MSINSSYKTDLSTFGNADLSLFKNPQEVRTKIHSIIHGYCFRTDYPEIKWLGISYTEDGFSKMNMVELIQDISQIRFWMDLNDSEEFKNTVETELKKALEPKVRSIAWEPSLSKYDLAKRKICLESYTDSLLLFVTDRLSRDWFDRSEFDGLVESITLLLKTGTPISYDVKEQFLDGRGVGNFSYDLTAYHTNEDPVVMEEVNTERTRRADALKKLASCAHVIPADSAAKRLSVGEIINLFSPKNLSNKASNISEKASIAKKTVEGVFHRITHSPWFSRNTTQYKK